MNLVTSEELGSSLQDVNMLIKKNKTLKGEIENHEPRINTVRSNGQNFLIKIIQNQMNLNGKLLISKKNWRI